MFPTPPTTSGGNTSLMFEPTSEGDSLTQFLRALNNYLQAQGKSTYDTGQSIFGAGANVAGQAPGTLQPTIDYWTKLLSGDKTAMNQAVAPTATAIGNQYDTASRSAATSLPRGGYSSGLQASLPFQKATQIGSLFEKLQPMAAQELQGAAQTQGALGQNIANLGLGESGLGFNLFNLASNNQLTRRGQNNQTSMNNLNNLTSGLKSVFSGLV